MKKLFLAGGIINAICLVAIILYVAVIMPAFSMWFYRWQFKANDSYAAVGMEQQELDRVAGHTIRYIRGLESSLQIRVIRNGEEQYFFNDLDIRHMKDVRNLFVGAMIAAIVLSGIFLATLASLLIWGRKNIRQFFRGWQITSLATFSLFALLIILVLINWSRSFDIFHEIFFNNNYWVLDDDSLLLEIMPHSLFMSASMFIGIIFSVGLTLIFAASTYIIHRQKRKDFYSLIRHL